MHKGKDVGFRISGLIRKGVGFYGSDYGHTVKYRGRYACSISRCTVRIDVTTEINVTPSHGIMVLSNNLTNALAFKLLVTHTFRSHILTDSSPREASGARDFSRCWKEESRFTEWMIVKFTAGLCYFD